MKLYLAPEITAKFPDYVMYTVVARDINNNVDAAELVSLLGEAAASARQATGGDPKAHPRIASWREAFRSFGADPDEHLPAIQSLVQAALEGRHLPHAVPVVALSNYISLKYLLPSGADDLTHVVGDFGIRAAQGDEIYVPLGSSEVEPPDPGEVIYADQRKVMCRRWTWLQGEHTKVTRQTRDVTINIDVLPPATREEGERAVQELIALLRRFCGGEITYNVLDRSHRQEEVPAPPARDGAENVYDVLEMRGYIRRTSDREGVRALLSQPATIYQGFDPTADSLHIGHLLSLMVFRYLQRAGHRMIFLIGGGTGQVGDPTGKTKSRRVMTNEEIERNKVAIQQQVQEMGLADFESSRPGQPKALMLNNAAWLNMPLFTYLREVALHFSVNRMLRMETFAQRLANQGHLSLFEFLYPTMQGFDFYHFFREYGCRLQLGGDDQWTNILAGMDLIGHKLGEQVYAMTFSLLLDASGAKMGKTAEGEAIWLNAKRTTPFAFYQYWVNRPDPELRRNFRLFTFLPLDEINDIVAGDPRIAQHRLAYEVTMIVHGAEAAKQAQEDAHRAFGPKAGLPEDVPTVTATEAALGVGLPLINVIAEAEDVSSRSQARQLIKQGAVRINDVKETDLRRLLTSDDLVVMGGQQAILIRYRKGRVLKVVIE